MRYSKTLTVGALCSEEAKDLREKERVVNRYRKDDMTGVALAVPRVLVACLASNCRFSQPTGWLTSRGLTGVITGSQASGRAGHRAEDC